MPVKGYVCLLLDLIVLVSCRQQWVEQPGHAEVNPGGTVTLPCKVRGKKGECRWERNALPVGAYPGKYEWAGNQEAGDCSLLIREASKDYDSGEWVCQITASSFMEKDTLMSRPARLIVREPPRSVHLRSSATGRSILGPISGPEGLQERIDCVAVGGSPPPQLRWFLGDREIPAEHSGLDSAGEMVSSVLVRMEKGEHGKPVRCEALHPALHRIVDVKSFLDIQYSPVVEITSSTPLTNLVEGDRVQLNCVVDANPPASVLWYRDGTGEIASKMTELSIPRVDLQSAGTYVCLANNTLGSSQAKSVEIQVQYSPVIESVGPRLKIRQLYGTKLVLTCGARGNPYPSFTWIQYKSSGLEVRGEGRDLVIERLVYEDEGSYECRAVNSILGQRHETKSKPIKVDVYGSPKVDRKVSEVYVSKGSTGRIEVEFCADPLPKQIWHIDSHPGQKIVINEGTSHAGYSVLNATKSGRRNCYVSTLQIREVKEEDGADYVVHFENDHGREIHTVRVKIGAFLGKETLIGGLIGGGMTLLIILLLVVCCCTKCARNNKARKRDQESGGSGEVWSTGSVCNSEAEQQSEISTANTANTSHSAISTDTRHSVVSIATTRLGSITPRNGVSASPRPNPSSAVESILYNGPLSPFDRKNISFNEDVSVSQECLKARPPTVPVNYNDLCFPKTSNYGSMRKQERCDILSRANIKKIDEIVQQEDSVRHSPIQVNSEYQYS